jgi:hypothetical protein
MNNHYKTVYHRLGSALAIICLPGTLLCICPAALRAQDNDSQLSAIILHRDSLFWQAYNSCDVENMKSFFTEDVEFYHDKGGVTIGLETLLASMKSGICGTKDSSRLRREEVKGSVHVFPMRSSGVIYGAILSGEHQFYVILPGKHGRLDGLAKFTHLWLLKNGVWKMSRILSYDHGPAPFVQTKKEIVLPENLLRSYAAKYKGAQTGLCEVQLDSGRLILLLGKNRMTLYPEKDNRFFSRERNLEFEFIKDGKEGMKMIVYENEDLAEELIRQ